MNEELINEIVRHILSDPSMKRLLHGNGSLELEKSIKSEALVLLNFAQDLPRVLNKVQERWGTDYRLIILPSDQVYSDKPDLPVGMTWVTAQDALVKSDWQKLILPTCSPNTMSKAALGIRDNPICEMIGRGISNGISIELVTEYLGLTAKTPQAYRELYEGYIQKLQSYGVMVYATLEVGCPLSSIPVQKYPTNHHEQTSGTYEQNKTIYRESASMQEEIRFAKKFLGEKQAYGFPEKSRVLIKSGTVISPLARDTLKLRQIELYIEKEDGRG